MIKIYLNPDDKHFVTNNVIKFRTNTYTSYVLVKTVNGWTHLHRLIMGLDKNSPLVVHHRDGNGLNNKRENLLICTTMFNNQGLNKINNPKFGYIYQNKRGSYEVYHQIFGKRTKKTFKDYPTAFKYSEKQKELELIKLKNLINGE